MKALTKDTKPKDNGILLREVVEQSGMTQMQALERLNENQTRPLALSTWKAYLSAEDSTRRRLCPDNILDHAKKVLKAKRAK